MGCWSQWPLWTWVLWGLWVLPGKCQGQPHRCRANQMASTIWVTAEGLPTTLRGLNTASLSPSAQPAFAPSLPAGAAALTESPGHDRGSGGCS